MIRRAGPGDLPALAALHAACFSQAWDENSLGVLLDSPDVFALMTEDGFVLARAAADEAEILTLAVEPARRRSGLGRALVQAAAREAARDGATALFLEVGAGNAAARGLYDGLGFREAGRRKAYYGGSEDALVLKAGLPLDLGA